MRLAPLILVAALAGAFIGWSVSPRQGHCVPYDSSVMSGAKDFLPTVHGEIERIYFMAESACEEYQRSSATFPSMDECIKWNFGVSYDSIVRGIGAAEPTGPGRKK